ncbi:MAG: hypothetical protein ABIQ89_04330 [Candidatus Saccharimonadales bacterium]
MSAKKPTITICSSSNFYKQAIVIRDELETAGLTVLIPELALKMKENNDFDVSHYKTWFGDANDYPKKARLIRGHFAEVANGDAILVLNHEKHGVKNYIGGNVLMEMAIAFHLNKPIFIENDAPEESNYIEEIMGMQPIFLHGNIKDLPKKLSNLL